MAEPMGQTTSEHHIVARQALRSPSGAAVAGILFAILFTASIVLIRLVVPEDLGGTDIAGWLKGASRSVSLALTLVPFAGIAFLWFMGVVRDRLGELEDRFLATVFLGSGLLFLAMVFSSAALAAGILASQAAGGDAVVASGTLVFGRSVMNTIMNVYAIRMAGVFMMSLGTIWMRTRIMPRIFVFLTYGLALFLLVAINLSLWLVLVFPAWVLAVSVFVLVSRLRGEAAEGEAALGSGA
jgi:hypothetical protein